MEISKTSGRISSLQSLGTLDGPGVRFVVFLQGCPLRCGCCHNPETWETDGGTIYTSEQLFKKIINCKDYFGKNGGVTLSGGEPLLQADFCTEIFGLCKAYGINTCLDTSGCILNDSVKKLLTLTDLVLLDIKYTEADKYLRYVGCELAAPLKFLNYLEKKNIPVWIRQVIIPSLNDSEENISRLSEIAAQHKNIKRTELLPFKKFCKVKYEKLGIKFPFENIDEPNAAYIKKLESMLKLN